MDGFLSPLKYDAFPDFCRCFFVHNGPNVGRQAPMIATALSAKIQNRGLRYTLGTRTVSIFQDIKQLFLVRGLTQGISAVDLSVMVGELDYLVDGSYPCNSGTEYSVRLVSC